MKKFKVEIIETLSKIVEVEAETETEAVMKVEEMHQNEEIVLDEFDYVDAEIEIFKES